MKSLYRATRVRTFSHPAEGEWMLVDGRHVQRVGSGEPPEADRIVDLPGATIIPGFIDAHVHLTGTGLNGAGISAAEADGIDGIERDGKGWPTGVLRREANAAAQRWFHASLPEQRIEQYQLDAAGLAASRGITCVHEMAIPDL